MVEPHRKKKMAMALLRKRHMKQRMIQRIEVAEDEAGRTGGGSSKASAAQRTRVLKMWLPDLSRLLFSERYECK